ncbi:DNA-binding transcriptional regulator, XRE-family HTH domain [Alkalibacterium putridalgicola]|uniref:DNA-binding transcriptional regulator, XRE-family HTH domain n=1 Tax=Alkalibacterium putridalgicola TaxID=426703 RepID=A0A1H7RPM0_9LACT|nr:helix-turn-helix transcriptional regulator [Alkalibacterium putridalgicola]GEK88922.1 hypothetical protein APU01nite_09610 [Alkalibacterium putridalgicola]SEL61948.1 DNA-binding transcriptional regulator, XRE-family HTH domain [Alkalibacterium putridalgicola]
MIGERLKSLRKTAQQTQEDVAKSIGVSRAAYSHFENNRNEPDIEIIKKLSDHFQVSTDYILGSDIPSWATQEDVIEIEKILDENAKMTFGGEELNEEEREDVRQVLRASLWRKLQKKKVRDTNE